MSPRSIADLVHREVPLLRAGQTVDEALPILLDSGLPALPVVDEDGRYVGIFGEREFIGALFPGYVRELDSASFIPKSIESAFEKTECHNEPVSKHMNTEHIDVPTDYADMQLAETFLHHRVLIVPVTSNGQVQGVITRSEFFETLGRRFLDR